MRVKKVDLCVIYIFSLDGDLLDINYQKFEK